MKEQHIVVREDGVSTLPDGEPVFVLRAQDVLAPSAVARWIEDAVRFGASTSKLESAGRHLEAMTTWQNAHGDRVKTPD